MKKIIYKTTLSFVSIFMLALITSAAHGEYTVGKVSLIRTTGSTGHTDFGIENPDSSNTCSCYGYNFRFNTATPGGKAMHSNLLTAKASDKEVLIWYDASTTPGTNNTNGCTWDTLAVTSGIGIR